MARATTAPASPPDTHSRRSSGFHPLSLAVRLLVVILVPTVVLGVLAYREVSRRGDVADNARLASDEMSLLQDSQELVVPLYREFDSADGLRQAELIGVDRNTVVSMVGLDFVAVTITARADLDAAISRLVGRHGDVLLPDGQTIRSEVEEATDALAAVRTAFDDEHLADVDLSKSYGVLIDMMEDIDDHIRAVLLSTSRTPSLSRIAAETRSYQYALAYVADEVRAVVMSSSSSGDMAPVYDMVASSGAFRASLDRLKDLLTPERAATLDALRAKPSFTSVDRMETTWMLAVSQAVAANEVVATRPDALNAITELLSASFVRLTDLQEYGRRFLAEEAAFAGKISSDAAARELKAKWWMFGAMGGSLLLLILLVASVLRPVRALVRTSRQVREGDLDVQPARPSGPTDIRVLTQTFNEMVVTLRAFDAQVRRLAQGDTALDHQLPGPLGESLRDSVGHLAAVTQRLHTSEAAAIEQARLDSLTGLANRTAVLERLADIGAGARATGQPGAIVFLDLDGFKNVNDTQGHGAGDRILRQIGTRLRLQCPNDLVARIGGDEFIVLIEQAGPIERIEAFAEQLIRLISEPCEARDGQQFTLTASAGVTLVDGSRDPLECIAEADSAVYRAKEQGRSRVEAYDEELAAEIETRSEMALLMRRGLQENAFTLHLQPIIDLATDRPVGAEALLRWTLPDGRTVSPSEFIPIAERSGVIVAIDEWVIDHAMAVLSQWRDDPQMRDLRLSVNVSGRHVGDGSLARIIAEKCAAAGVAPHRLTVEVTETYLMSDPVRARLVVDDLHALGVSVAIDDFGTGYSSMSSLHELPADTLKIDQLFVSGLTRSSTDRTIVELVLRLAQSLGMQVIAEGVDSEDKLQELKLLGCQAAQGFHIAVPMDLATCTRWLQDRIGDLSAHG